MKKEKGVNGKIDSDINRAQPSISGETLPAGSSEVKQIFKSPLRGLVKAVFILVFLLFAVGIALLLFNKLAIPIPGTPMQSVKLKKFESEKGFKDYIQEGKEVSGLGGGFAVGIEDRAGGLKNVGQAPSAGLGTEGPVTAQRISETNVQVVGVDEPDIVKTDGTSIYFSSNYNKYYPMTPDTFEQPVSSELKMTDIMPSPRYFQSETKIIKAFPVKELEETAKIEDGGNLLISSKMLVVFSNNNIFGYDVSNPGSSLKNWTYQVTDGNEIITSRLYNSTLYIVMRTDINNETP